MPDAVVKYSDWQAPWEKAGTAFDAETAKRLIYQLKVVDKANHDQALAAARDSLKEAQDRVTALETAADKNRTPDQQVEARIAKLDEAIAKLTNPQAPPTSAPAGGGNDGEPPFDREKAQLSVALELGLTAAQAKRLVGDDEDAIRADAKAYMQEQGMEVPGSEDGQGGEGGSNTPPAGQPNWGYNQPLYSRPRTGMNGSQDLPDESDPAKLFNQRYAPAR